MTPALSSISIYKPTYTIVNNTIVRERYINTADANGDFPVTDSCERSATIMNDDYVKLSFKLLEQYVFEAFAYIWYDNQLFFLKEEYRPTAKGSYYQYEMKFVSVANMLDKHICFRYLQVADPDNKGAYLDITPEPEINMNGTLAELAEIVLTSIKGAANRLNSDQPQLLYSYILHNLTIADDMLENTALETFSFSGQNISDVLTQIAETYEIEWWLTQESPTQVQLHLCKCECNDTIVLSDQFKDTGNSLQPYESRGLLSCEYSQEWSDIAQKIIPFGSDRNITRSQALQTINGNDMYVSYGKQLRLAPNTTYTVTNRNGDKVQITTDLTGALTNTAVKSGIETTKQFDDIYPRCHFRVIGVTHSGTDNPIYTITAAAIKADGISLMSYDDMVTEGLLPLQIEPNETLSVIFESGYLNGREFEVKHSIKQVETKGQTVMQWRLTIVPEEGGDDGVSLPFGNFVPREKTETYEGDMFAIFHMIMPQAYITRAQEELAQAAYNELLAIEDARPEIKCKSEPLFFANQTLCLGQRIAVHSELFGEIKKDANGDIAYNSPSLFASRVTSLSHSLTQPDNVEFKLASSRIEGKIAAIESVIADQTNDIRGLEQRSLNLSRRGWHDAQEMRDMLDSLAAEFLLVGVEKNQFAFTSAIYCVNGNIISQQVDDSVMQVNHFKHLHISAGYIQHTQEPYIKYSNGGRWGINEIDITTDENDNSILYNATDTEPSEKAFYLYAICSSTSTTAQIVLSDTTHDSDTDYLLMGILSSEFLDTLTPNNTTSFRVFNRSNGYTQIAGGTITTEQIQDPTRSLIIDFQSAPPRIIARNGAKIIGNVEFSLSEENIQQVLQQIGTVGGENLFDFGNPYQMSAGTNNYAFCVLLSNLQNGSSYIFSCEKAECITGTATMYSVVLYNFNTDQSIQPHNLAIGNATQSCTFNIPDDDNNYCLLLYSGVVGSTAGNNIRWSDIMIQKGNRETAYQQPAWKRLYYEFETNIGYVTTALIQSKVLLTNLPAGKYKAMMTNELTGDGATNAYMSNSCLVWYDASMGSLAPDSDIMYVYGDAILAVSDWGEEVTLTETANVAVYTGSKEWALKAIEDGLGTIEFSANGTWMVRFVHISTYVTDANLAETRALDYLKTALQGSTEIAGGLLMTNLLMLKNEKNKVTAGMSGLTGTETNPEKVLLWGGGTYKEALKAIQGLSSLPVLLTKAGAGSNIGCLKVMSDNKTIMVTGAEGSMNVVITSETSKYISQNIYTGYYYSFQSFPFADIPVDEPQTKELLSLPLLPDQNLTLNIDNILLRTEVVSLGNSSSFNFAVQLIDGNTTTHIPMVAKGAILYWYRTTDDNYVSFCRADVVFTTFEASTTENKTSVYKGVTISQCTPLDGKTLDNSTGYYIKYNSSNGTIACADSAALKEIGIRGLSVVNYGITNTNASTVKLVASNVIAAGTATARCSFDKLSVLNANGLCIIASDGITIQKGTGRFMANVSDKLDIVLDGLPTENNLQAENHLYIKEDNKGARTLMLSNPNQNS